VVNHFIASDDVERSARFYTEVLGGRVVFSPVPTVVELSNSFIVINAGGGPTDDKPTVTLETPRDPGHRSRPDHRPPRGLDTRRLVPWCARLVISKSKS
jgi:catechol 2,3-dioxygenase-like lactoylglutathione lyase family enzyme